MTKSSWWRQPVSWKTVVMCTMAAWLIGEGVAWAAQSHFLGVVFIGDPTTPTQQASVNASGQLAVQCANCSGSGVSTTNNTAYDGTANTTVSATAGAEAVTSAPTLTNGRNYSMFMDTSGNLRTNCVTGCAGGTFNNNADGVATSATNGQSASWLYDYNGTSFDRIRGAANSLNSTGTGLLGAQNIAQCDDTTPTAITENNFFNLRGGCSDHSMLIGALKSGVATGLLLGSQTSANSLAVTIASDYGLAAGSTTSGQLGSIVMGAVTTAAPSYTTAQTNFLSLTTAGGLRGDLSSVAGTTTDTNSGNKSAGTLRVVLATDQPALTNKLLVTPDSVALPANQSVNVSQINGVTPLMGAGNTGTGSPRVTIATDQAALAGVGAGATGSAVPANAVYQGANIGGNTTGLISCQSSVIYDASTNGSTELVALTSSQSVYICGYSIFAAGTVNVELDYGTGTACATGTNKITPAFQLTTQTGIVDGSPYYRGAKTAASNALCLKTSAGIAVQAIVYYTKF